MIDPINCCSLSFTPEYQRTLSPSTLTLLSRADSGINEPWYGQLGDGVYGYFKSCAHTDPAMDELEVLLVFLGSRLGMTMAETCLLLDAQGSKLGIFSVDTAKKGETYLTADHLKDQWLTKLDPIPSWALRAHALHQAAPKLEPLPDYKFSIVEDPVALKQLLEFIYGVLSLGGQYDVRGGFTDMVLFDCMLWQKDRNMKGFGLVKNADGTVRMSSLYDNASIVMPGLPETVNGFCNILCHREQLARCTAELFPGQSLDFAARLEGFLLREGDSFRHLYRSLIPPAYGEQLERRMACWEALIEILFTHAKPS